MAEAGVLDVVGRDNVDVVGTENGCLVGVLGVENDGRAAGLDGTVLANFVKSGMSIFLAFLWVATWKTKNGMDGLEYFGTNEPPYL